MQEIDTLTETLIADSPKGLLYHYTTLSGLLGIVRSRTLWAPRWFDSKPPLSSSFARHNRLATSFNNY